MTREMLPDIARMAGAVLAYFAFAFMFRESSAWTYILAFMLVGAIFQPAAMSLYRKREAWRRSRYAERLRRQRDTESAGTL